MRIVVWIGTQAEMLKMTPVLKSFDLREMPYYFVHTGQHTEYSRDIIETFNLKTPDIFLTQRNHNLKKVSEAVGWLISTAWKTRLRNLFGRNDLILVHGDTESTLLGTMTARLSGCRLGHLEAGLRSNNLFDPFPEEFIRRVSDRCSDYLYVPGSSAVQNAGEAGLKGEIIDTRHNTIMETVALAREITPTVSVPPQPYAVLMLHRKETLYIRKNLKRALRLIRIISDGMKTVFVASDKTSDRLKRSGYWNEITANPNITVIKHQMYHDFIHLVSNSEFVATDGGSLQEETYLLNKPCIILRMVTERTEGLGETAVLSRFSESVIRQFLNEYTSHRRTTNPLNCKPSNIITDHVLSVTG